MGVCPETVFVATKVLSRQKWYLWQLLPMIPDFLSELPDFLSELLDFLSV